MINKLDRNLEASAFIGGRFFFIFTEKSVSMLRKIHIISLDYKYESMYSTLLFIFYIT